MAISPQRMYDLFVGNKKNHIIFEKVWKRSFFPISINLIMRHMRHDVAIGSYAIYKEDGNNYCKWICIDLDSHERVPVNIRHDVWDEYEDQPKVAKLILKKLEKEYSKKIDQNIKAEYLRMIEELYNRNETLSWKWLGIPNEYIVLEDSVGGYHLWIFLEDKTPLEDVGKWVFNVIDRMIILHDEFFLDAEYPEYYPKQYGTKHLDKGLGSGVRLPLGYNFNKKGASKILRGDLKTVKKFDLHNLVKDWEVPDYQIERFNRSCRRQDIEVYNAQEIPLTLDFYMELPIRSCLKRIITGETQCFDNHGHLIRMALVHECKYIKMPKEVMIDCFKNQYDFDEEKTQAQLDSVLDSSNRKDGRYGCHTIRELGYCHECGYNNGIC